MLMRSFFLKKMYINTTFLKISFSLSICISRLFRYAIVYKCRFFFNKEYFFIKHEHPKNNKEDIFISISEYIISL